VVCGDGSAGEIIQLLIQKWMSSMLKSNGMVMKNLLQRFIHSSHTINSAEFDGSLLLSLLRLIVFFTRLALDQTATDTQKQIDHKRDQLLQAINQCLETPDGTSREIPQIKTLSKNLDQLVRT
jgi:aminopeptidase C